MRSRNTPFLVLWVTQAVSVLGSGAASFALGLVVFEQTGSTTSLALVTAVGMFGSIYLAPTAGAVSDHFGRRATALVCNAALAGISLGLAGLAAAGAADHFGPVLVLVFAAAVLNAALSLTLTASVREMRQDADLTRINGLTSLLERGPTVVAPAVGAVLYTTVDPAAVFLLDGATFALGAVVAALVDWRSPPRRPGRSLRPFSGSAAGVRHIWADPALRHLQLTFLGINFFNGLSIAAVTAYVVESARGDGDDPAVALGLTTTAAAVGLVAGSLLVLARGHRWDRVTTVGAGVVLGAVLGRVGLVLTGVVAVWVAASFMRNLFVQAQNAPLTALWQEQIPAGIQGTVFGARRLLGQGLYPFAVLLGGVIADALGPLGAVTSSAVLVAAAAVAEAALGVSLLTSARFRALARAPGPGDRPR